MSGFATLGSKLHDFAVDLVTHKPFYEYLVDAIVISNAAFVGLEVDQPDLVKEDFAKIIRIIFCVIYIIEFLVRLAMDLQHFRKLRLQVEMLVVLVAAIGAFGFPEKKILWRLSVWRLIRLTRVVIYSSRSARYADLWLVLTAFWRSLLAIRWLVLILFFSVIFFGGAARGFIFNGPDDDELNIAVCGRPDVNYHAFRIYLSCIDVDEYFGSMYKTCFTMMQLVTLDRWAAHVVRPLAGMRPDAAFFLFCFVLACTYGLMSIATGVLVWSTVEKAKEHRVHRNNVTMVTDKDRIKDLRDYFHKCLVLEDRSMLDLREIKEAMAVPQVKQVFEELNLPVVDVQQLWTHLDMENEGEITLEQFEQRCWILLEPAKRFDMACLSARLNGRAVFAENLGKRCDVTAREIDNLCKKLSVGFRQMRRHVLSEEVNDIFPEVGLRRGGKMRMPPYTTDE